MNRGDESSDDDTPRLLEKTLQALQEFYREQDEALVVGISSGNCNSVTANESLFNKDINTAFPEDWQMSQFWYDDATSEALANLVKGLLGPQDKVACLSCPSVFRACGFSENIHLYEYDKRFAAFGSTYFFYDYNVPLEVPQESIASYEVVIADPPFLAEECLEKLSLTVKRLVKPNGKIIVCTGAVMEKKAGECLNVYRTSFIPTHKNNLGNSFVCFANFDLEIKKDET